MSRTRRCAMRRFALLHLGDEVRSALTAPGDALRVLLDGGNAELEAHRGIADIGGVYRKDGAGVADFGEADADMHVGASSVIEKKGVGHNRISEVWSEDRTSYETRCGCAGERDVAGIGASRLPMQAIVPRTEHIATAGVLRGLV